MRRVAIVLLSVVTLAVLFFVLCTFRVRPYEETILVRFGRVIPPAEQTRIAYGWYLCLPTDSVVAMDKRLHLYQSLLLEDLTKSKDPISVRAFATWRIVDAKKFYEKFQGSDETARVTLDGKMMAAVADVLGGHNLDDLFGASVLDAGSPATHPTHEDEAGGPLTAPATREAGETTMTEQMEQEITGRVTKEMEPLGMQVTQVGFSRMAFPFMVAQSVYKRMAQERGVLASTYRSEGDTKAANIRTEADGIAKDARSEAEKAAQGIRGEGDSKALAILAEVQRTPEARAFYQFLREMDMVKNSIGKNTYLMLKANQPVMQQLFPDSAKPAAEGAGK